MLGVDGFWVYVFIFLIGGVWIQISGWGSRSGVVKVLELFVYSVWLVRKCGK